MGCPDWPRCFGKVAPPIDSSSLPADYKEIFLNKRVKKVQRFASLLDKIGMHGKANALRAEQNVYVPESFNATKAWIEYINRIFGVLSGLAALLFLISAIINRKTIKGLLLYTVLGFVFLIINAWLGSIVVATNLLPGIVTLHFLLSFICLFFFMTALHRASSFEIATNALHFGPIYKFLFVASVIEVFLGTYSREIVEQLRQQGNVFVNDQLNVHGMGTVFMVHRFLPAAMIAIIASLWFKHHKTELRQSRLLLIVALVILAQISVGAVNIVYRLPSWSQTLHIFIGSSLPVIFFYLSLAKPKQVSLSQ